MKAYKIANLKMSDEEFYERRKQENEEVFKEREREKVMREVLLNKFKEERQWKIKDINTVSR